MTTEPRWQAMLRAEVKRTSLRKAGARLNISDTTISQVLGGKYPYKTERIAERVLKELKPPRRVPAARPAQLRQLDPVLHRAFRTCAELIGARSLAQIIGLDEQRVWPLIRSTDPQGAADVLDTLRAFRERMRTEVQP